METYKFNCKSIGMDCGFETHAGSMDELMPKIADHAEKVHQIKAIPSDLKEKITNAIKIEH